MSFFRICRRRALLLGGFCLETVRLHALPPASTERELKGFFVPAETIQTALAPDGRHLAFIVHPGSALNLVIMDVDNPAHPFIEKLGDDQPPRDSNPLAIQARLGFLSWISSGKLAYQVTVPGPGRLARIELRTVEANGRNDRKVIDGNDIAMGRAPVQPFQVFGTLPDDPGTFVIQLRYVDSIEARLVDAGTGKDTSLGYQQFGRDVGGRPLFDRQGRLRMFQLPDRGAGFPQTIAFVPLGPGQGRSLSSLKKALHLLDGVDWNKFLGEGALGEIDPEVKDFYKPRSFPLAFDADPNLLYFASNVGRDTYGIYALDLQTRKPTDFAVEDPGFDLVDPASIFTPTSLVFDRQKRLAGVRLPTGTRWLSPSMAKLQAGLDNQLGGKRVEILEWNDTYDRVLARVSTLDDPGRYCVIVMGQPGRIVDFMPRAPWMPATMPGRSEGFTIDTPAGVSVSGIVTMPVNPRAKLPPLIVYDRDIPGSPIPLGFDPDTQALAAMGYAVARVNHRGVSGRGIRFRDSVKTEGFDAAPIDDLRAAIAWIKGKYPIDTKRIALMGSGMGGFIALRALELHPDEFRSVVALEAPTDPAAWVQTPPLRVMRDRSVYVTTPAFVRRNSYFGGSISQLEKISVLPEAGNITVPVMYVGRDIPMVDIARSQITDLGSALKKAGNEMTLFEPERLDDPDSRAELFVRIGEFLRSSFYDYGVEIGDLKVIENPKPAPPAKK